MNKMLNVNYFWTDDQQGAVYELCGNESRKRFVEQMRIIESTLSRCSITYMLKVAETELKAVEYLIMHCKANNKTLDITHKHFYKKYKNLRLLKNNSTKGLPDLNKKHIMAPQFVEL